ncbi:hypothetical protein QTV25_002212, partial [Staphylococcus pseudintermedius]|nr:hypothetical protein [Staphylococcus pseudintermedius]
FNNKEVEIKISNDFATVDKTVFVLALKYKDAFEIFEISQMYFSDYITIKAKCESVDVRSKEEFDFALERIIMRYMQKGEVNKMFIIEYTYYSPNDENHYLDDYFFTEKEKAVEYLKNEGFEWEQHNTYKKGEIFGVRANIILLAKFD